MATQGVNNLRVHKASWLVHFTPKPEKGDMCLTIPRSHLNHPNSHVKNKKQCSRQLQCEVPCAGNVTNSSLSSLSSTSHAVRRGSGCVGGFGHGGRGVGGGGEGEGQGAGDISSTLPCTALAHGGSPQRDFAQWGVSPHFVTPGVHTIDGKFETRGRDSQFCLILVTISWSCVALINNQTKACLCWYNTLDVQIPSSADINHQKCKNSECVCWTPAIQVRPTQNLDVRVNVRVAVHPREQILHTVLALFALRTVSKWIQILILVCVSKINNKNFFGEHIVLLCPTKRNIFLCVVCPAGWDSTSWSTHIYVSSAFRD